MVRHTIAILLLLACAALPTAWLHFSIPEERTSMGLTAAGFGWPRVLVVHLVAAIPLGLLIPLGLNLRSAIVAGLGVSALGVGLAPAIAANLNALEAGFLARVLVRGVIAVGLIAPWIYVLRVVWR